MYHVESKLDIAVGPKLLLGHLEEEPGGHLVSKGQQTDRCVRNRRGIHMRRALGVPAEVPSLVLITEAVETYSDTVGHQHPIRQLSPAMEVLQR